MRLMAAGDMHALMFRLRSELMRGAAGGNGYNRDGNVAFRKHRFALHPTCISPTSPPYLRCLCQVAFRKHRFALNLIGRSQSKVVRALRYVASGTVPPPPPHSAPTSAPNSEPASPGGSARRRAGHATGRSPASEHGPGHHGNGHG